MGRYANATIRLDFPDLSEDDDLIFVTIRNPKTVPADKLAPAADVPDGPDGEPDRRAATDAAFHVMAGLVVDWHVYDANLDDGPPLPTPATVEALRALPFEIVSRISDEIAAVTVNPR